MRSYAVFYKIDLAGQISELLGSDGAFRLDARRTKFHQHFEAKQRAEMLNRNLNKGIVAYRLFRGECIGTMQPNDGFRYMDLESHAYARCLKAGIKCRCREDELAIRSFIRSSGAKNIITASLQDILATANCF